MNDNHSWRASVPFGFRFASELAFVPCRTCHSSIISSRHLTWGGLARHFSGSRAADTSQRLCTSRLVAFVPVPHFAVLAVALANNRYALTLTDIPDSYCWIGSRLSTFHPCVRSIFGTFCPSGAFVAVLYLRVISAASYKPCKSTNQPDQAVF